MYALTLLVAAVGLVAAAPSSDMSIRQVAQVASLDRSTGPGCTGTICNKAGSGDLFPGCNKITDTCTNSLKLNYANLGCTVTAYSDAACSKNAKVINDYNCYDPALPILSVKAVC